MEYPDFYYKQQAHFTYRELFSLDRKLKDENYSKEIKKFVEKLIHSKSNTMFINLIEDQKIENERKKNYELNDIAETETDFKRRIEKESNIINNKKALFDEELLRLNVFSIEPIYSLTIFRSELRRIIDRIKNFQNWKFFTLPKESGDTRDLNTGKIKKDYIKEFNQAEKNYKQFGLAETDSQRKFRLNLIQNYKKSGKYLDDNEIDLLNYDGFEYLMNTHKRREHNLEMYGNFDGFIFRNYFNEIEKKENYKNYGLPETVYEKVFRENLTSKINNWNEISKYFYDDLSKKDWSLEITKLNERIDNLKNSDFAETNIERKYRLETEKNYDHYNLAESNKEREKRLEIENNIIKFGLAYSDDELLSFHEYSERLKIYFRNK